MRATVQSLSTRALAVPTETPESDGTLDWSGTELVVVEVGAGETSGLGYSYTSRAAAHLIDRHLRPVVVGEDALSPAAAWQAMCVAVRNLGFPGVAASAVAAVDVALWDLKARLLGLPLVTLLGQVRDRAPAYGSGGFTSYDVPTLCRKLAAWSQAGFRAVKMKVGREPELDPERVRAARQAIGERCRLYVDANGAYGAQQATQLAQTFFGQGVTWFEEPVSSDDWDGLERVRRKAPAGMEVVAGEYVYSLWDALRIARCVDVLNPDATRCGGVTGFLKVAALAEALHLPMATHCAPALSAHLACAVAGVRCVEHFFDHARIESLLFEGVPLVREGALEPELDRPGHGLRLRQEEARRFASERT